MCSCYAHVPATVLFHIPFNFAHKTQQQQKMNNMKERNGFIFVYSFKVVCVLDCDEFYTNIHYTHTRKVLQMYGRGY